MILSALHFLSIVITFALIVIGYPYYSLIPFAIALLLTFIIYKGKRGPRKSDKADNTPYQKNETAEKLTKVLLNRTHGNQVGSQEYWQNVKDENVGTIQIDRSSHHARKQKSIIPIFWLLFFLGVIIWGAYNLIIHDKPYVPLSRVYEKNLEPENTYQSHQPQNKSQDPVAANKLSNRAPQVIRPQKKEKIVPNTTITQEMLDEAWGDLKSKEADQNISRQSVEPPESKSPNANDRAKPSRTEENLHYYYAIQLKTGERIISKTVVIDKDAVDYIDKDGLMTSVDRSLIESLKKYYYKRKN